MLRNGVAKAYDALDDKVLAAFTHAARPQSVRQIVYEVRTWVALNQGKLTASYNAHGGRVDPTRLVTGSVGRLLARGKLRHVSTMTYEVTPS